MADTLTLDILDPQGNTVGSIDLPAEKFDREPNIPLMHQVVNAQLAAARQGTHSTKTRGEVRGGGRKPWRQKGTGRARQGSIRAPHWVGGGVAHGPKPRDYSQRTPKKMKAAALHCALSDRARNSRIHAVSALVDCETPSTKAGRKVIERLVDDRLVLVVFARGEEEQTLSVRNLPQVQLLTVEQLNTYDVLNNEDLVITETALRSYLGETPNEEAKEA